MIPTSETPDLLEALRAAFRQEDPSTIAHLIEEIRPQELVEIWFDLTASEQVRILDAYSPEQAAELVSNFEEEERPAFMEGLSAPQAAEILEELSPDDLVDTLQALEAHDPEQAEEVFALLEPATQAVAEALDEFHEEDAGGIMTPDLISIRASMTVEQVLVFLRQAAPDAEQVYYLYVVDAAGRLLGVLSLRELIVAAPGTRVEEIMDPDVVSIHTEADQEEVAQLVADYDLSVLPVVDREGVLVGIITVDDILDVVEEEATEDMHLMGAAPVGIDYVRASPWLLFRKRGSWLILLVVSMSLTVNVMSHYDDVLRQILILAAFVPILIGTGGNIGSQVATLVVRALATRELEPGDYMMVLRKEVGTGLLLGLAFGSYMAAFILIVRPDASPEANLLIALALAVTMMLISLAANLVGASLPFLFSRLGLDPALSSSPGITTVTDVLGLLIYFRVVTWILAPLLAGG
jgi:magnesium transporter